MIHEFPNLSWTLNAFAQAFFFVSETLPLQTTTPWHHKKAQPQQEFEIVCGSEHLVGVRKHDR